MDHIFFSYIKRYSHNLHEAVSLSAKSTAIKRRKEVRYRKYGKCRQRAGHPPSRTWWTGQAKTARTQLARTRYRRLGTPSCSWVLRTGWPEGTLPGTRLASSSSIRGPRPHSHHRGSSRTGSFACWSSTCWIRNGVKVFPLFHFWLCNSYECNARLH